MFAGLTAMGGQHITTMNKKINALQENLHDVLKNQNQTDIRRIITRQDSPSNCTVNSDGFFDSLWMDSMTNNDDNITKKSDSSNMTNDDDDAYNMANSANIRKRATTSKCAPKKRQCQSSQERYPLRQSIRTKGTENHNSGQDAHAGLKNNGMICFSNAILQAFASCTHLTTLFQQHPSSEHKQLKLYYQFAKILHAMVHGQEDVITTDYITESTDLHPEFKDQQGKYQQPKE
jgi:ubiquitin C-terminal hydrolase